MMDAMRTLGLAGPWLAGLLALGCGGGEGDDGEVLFSAPRVHTLTNDFGDQEQVRDQHVLCTLDHEALHARVLMKAEPTGFQGFDVEFRAWRAYLLQGAEVRALPAADIAYEARHHGWDVMQVVVDGRRYVYRWSDACIGYRPCTPSFDRLDVRDAASADLVASMLPVTCAVLASSGKPMPLTPLARVPATGPEPEGFLFFDMGSQDGAADERPVHRLGLSPQRMDVREATWADLALFLDDHGPDCDGTPCLDLDAPGVGVAEVGGGHRAEPGREDEPAGHLSWAGAEAYCQWRGLDLPTEAAWEYAASAAGARAYPWGDEAPDCSRAVFADCQAAGPRAACSAPGGASPEGVCDLAGNLAEWVRDWYDPEAYAAACDPTTCTPGSEPPCESWKCYDPGGPEAPTGERVLRGGAFDSPAGGLRAAARGHAPPGTTAAGVGVRCSRPGHHLGPAPAP